MKNIVKLLRAMACGTKAIAARHDVIFNAAADLIEQRKFWLFEITFAEHDIPPTTGGLYTTRAAAEAGYEAFCRQEAEANECSVKDEKEDHADVEFYELEVLS